jgi:hypothetical protein
MVSRKKRADLSRPLPTLQAVSLSDEWKKRAKRLPQIRVASKSAVGREIELQTNFFFVARLWYRYEKGNDHVNPLNE